MNKLETLMQNAHVKRPEDIEGYLIGLKGTYEIRDTPDWIEKYRCVPRHHMYDFCIPWNREETRDILVRLQEESSDQAIKAFAQWGIDAWDEWMAQGD